LSSVLYGAALPLLTIAGAVFFLPIILLVFILYARALVVLARSCLKKGADKKTAVAYAVLNLICKVGSLLGSLQYFSDRARGSKAPRSELVVYRRDQSR
jgi:hypothetical protein